MKKTRMKPSIKDLAYAPPSPAQSHRCSALGCKNLTTRGAAIGLSDRYCRKHIEHISRHGSSWCKTLGGAALEPYRMAAGEWLKAKPQDDPFVRNAVLFLKHEMDEAGPILFVPLLRGEDPEGKAKQTFARLRETWLPPLLILQDVLGTMAALDPDLGLDGLDRNEDYRLTQIGKRIHRLAKGYKWDLKFPDGSVKRKQWHPEPRGQMLRRIGKRMLWIMDKGFGPQDVAGVLEIVKTKAKKD